MKPFPFNEIWLCDDDPDDHYVFAEALCQVLPGASLTIFSNAKDLLADLLLRKPDLLFLDMNMPTIDGLEALRKMREQPSLQDLHTVMYSVSELKSDISAAYQCGAVLFWVKPQLYQEVVRQLQAIFELEWNNPDYFAALQSNGTAFTCLKNEDGSLD